MTLKDPFLKFNISDLEAEMYQLGHFLAEQKSILSSQQDMSLFGIQGNEYAEENILIYICLQK